jgi:integrase
VRARFAETGVRASTLIGMGALLRHSFISLLSSSGVSPEDIADLCGHSGTTVTERVYRHQLRPVLLSGATAMDAIFGSPGCVVTHLVTQTWREATSID